MKNLRLVLGRSRAVIKPPNHRRRDHVRCRPDSEPLESRSLQSGLRAALAVAESLRPVVSVHVVPANALPAFKVSYQMSHAGTLSPALRSSASRLRLPAQWLLLTTRPTIKTKIKTTTSRLRTMTTMVTTTAMSVATVRRALERLSPRYPARRDSA